MIEGNGIGNFFQNHCLACFWLGYDQSSLSFADGGKHVDNSRSKCSIGMPSELEFFIREQRCQKIERDTVADLFRLQPIDQLYFHQRKKLLVISGRPDHSFYGISRFKTQHFDLIGSHIDIIG